MTSSSAREPSPPASLEDASVAVAVAVATAQEVVHAARRDLAAAINTARQAGEPINASPSAPAWMRWRCETSWPLLRPQRCTLVLAAHGRHAAEVPVYVVVGVEGVEPSRP